MLPIEGRGEPLFSVCGKDIACVLPVIGCGNHGERVHVCCIVVKFALFVLCECNERDTHAASRRSGRNMRNAYRVGEMEKERTGERMSRRVPHLYKHPAREDEKRKNLNIVSDACILPQKELLRSVALLNAFMNTSTEESVTACPFSINTHSCIDA